MGTKQDWFCLPYHIDAPGQDLTPPNLADLGFVDLTNGTKDATIIALTFAMLAWPVGNAPPKVKHDRYSVVPSGRRILPSRSFGLIP